MMILREALKFRVHIFWWFKLNILIFLCFSFPCCVLSLKLSLKLWTELILHANYIIITSTCILDFSDFVNKTFLLFPFWKLYYLPGIRQKHVWIMWHSFTVKPFSPEITTSLSQSFIKDCSVLPNSSFLYLHLLPCPTGLYYTRDEVYFPSWLIFGLVMWFII